MFRINLLICFVEWPGLCYAKKQNENRNEKKKLVYKMFAGSCLGKARNEKIPYIYIYIYIYIYSPDSVYAMGFSRVS